MKARLTLAFALLLVCTGAGIARAQTPDHLPPALETVCDAETGSAYGHCNSYCEAMDCDSDTPQASATACAKVRAKFLQTTGRDVPCELSCPCTSLPQFNADLAGLTVCRSSLDFYTEFAAGSSGGSFIGNFFFIECGSGPVVLPITSDEFAACQQLVFNAAASNSVTCTPL